MDEHKVVGHEDGLKGTFDGLGMMNYEWSAERDE